VDGGRILQDTLLGRKPVHAGEGAPDQEEKLYVPGGRFLRPFVIRLSESFNGGVLRIQEGSDPMGAKAKKDPVPRASIPLNPVFNWSVGNWMEYFYDSLRVGKIMGSKCLACGYVSLPPRMICERCFVKVEDWVELPASGTVQACTVASVKVAENGDLVDLEAPEVIAMVKHDGADTCIAGRLEGKDASVGMKVEAVIDTGAENVLDLIAAYRPLG
jgi:uncharacterized protein